MNRIVTVGLRRSKPHVLCRFETGRFALKVVVFIWYDFLSLPTTSRWTTCLTRCRYWNCGIQDCLQSAASTLKKLLTQPVSYKSVIFRPVFSIFFHSVFSETLSKNTKNAWLHYLMKVKCTYCYFFHVGSQWAEWRSQECELALYTAPPLPSSSPPLPLSPSLPLLTRVPGNFFEIKDARRWVLEHFGPQN